MLRAHINNYDTWYRNRIGCISRVIEEGNYKQDNNDTYFALSVKLSDIFEDRPKLPALVIAEYSKEKSWRIIL